MDRSRIYIFSACLDQKKDEEKGLVTAPIDISVRFPHKYLLIPEYALGVQIDIKSLKIKEIHQAVHHLPDIFRNPFMLYFDGYKYNEIATLLKEPLGTIKSRIHFARKLLKEQITRF